MAAVPVTQLTRAGIVAPAETAGDTTNGMTISNGGSMWFEARNSDTVARTFTVDVPGDIDGIAPPDRSYSLAAGEVRRCGPWPQAVYGNSLFLPTVSSALIVFRAFSM